MHRPLRAAFAAALMLAAAPAAAKFDQLYLEGDYVMWDQPPPFPVGRVDDPNLFEKLPTELQTELLRDLILTAFGTRPAPPLPTSLIEVPEGRIGVQIGGAGFDLGDPIAGPPKRPWFLFFFDEVGSGVNFVIDFLAGQRWSVFTNGSKTSNGDQVEVISYQSFIVFLTPPDDFKVEHSPTGYYVTGSGSNIGDSPDPIIKPPLLLGVQAPFAASFSGGSAPAFRMALYLETLRAAAPIPEPQTWALLIAGFGLVGGALRRRRREVVSA